MTWSVLVWCLSVRPEKAREIRTSRPQPNPAGDSQILGIFHLLLRIAVVPSDTSP